ncbi:MAG: hypothetical protein Q3M24_22515 [Candidatus Electrothrix aestuarii]|uniref:Uncharacterized protein n=1 Tax=Candidatus Electrothrix aestuarii TaxID=3062594 RepID=A0AAU8LUN8_9BACT|nr:hypothetical protein [Candidatus Electrothrix aestuarii]
MPQEEKEDEYSNKIIRLAHSCPLYLDNPNCPLKGVRKRELADKMRWFSCLSFYTKKTIYNYHLLCYCKHLDKLKEEDFVSSTKESDREKNICERMDIVVSDDVKDMVDECEKGFFCLNGELDHLCEVTDCVFESILYVKCLADKYCGHKYSVGENTFCSCPIRKEIYNKYHI